ncbi:MAG: hypothetical protein ABW168_20160 [Sedimenticola sp.]
MFCTQPIHTGYQMTNLPKCPQCGSEYTYEDGSL